MREQHMAGKRSHTMYRQIADTLRDRISSGVYRENELLPPELTLVDEFDVSRHTVRDAMKALVAEGLIERTAGRGTVVSPPSSAQPKWGVRSLADLVGEFSDSEITVLKKGAVSARSVKPTRSANSTAISSVCGWARAKGVLASRSTIVGAK